MPTPDGFERGPGEPGPLSAPTRTTKHTMKSPRYQVHHEVSGERIFLTIADTAEMQFDAAGRPNMANLARLAEIAPSAEREVFPTDTPATIMAKIAEMEVEIGMPLGVSNTLKEALAI